MKKRTTNLNIKGIQAGPNWRIETLATPESRDTRFNPQLIYEEVSSWYHLYHKSLRKTVASRHNNHRSQGKMDLSSMYWINSNLKWPRYGHRCRTSSLSLGLEFKLNTIMLKKRLGLERNDDCSVEKEYFFCGYTVWCYYYFEEYVMNNWDILLLSDRIDYVL